MPRKGILVRRLRIDVQKERVKQKVSVKRARRSAKRFVDRIRVKVTGGAGGRGCVSHTMVGSMNRPDGGHGGAGGNVIIVADPSCKSLGMPTHHFRGGDGTNGKGQGKAGRRGKDTVVRVPLGTVISTVEREEYWDEHDELKVVDHLTPICDLDSPDAYHLAGIGGKPGLGNRILCGKTTSFGRLRKNMSLEKVAGLAGTEGYLELEMKTIADVGLVGLPNSGKSTLLSTVCKAKPQIAAYPFTTLHPYVGTINFPDTYSFKMADLPGLIEGAHHNIGLGHDFLRHIERTKVLAYVLDTAASEGREPWDDLTTLQRELELYAANITERPSVIVANKMDAPGAADRLEKLRSQTSFEVIPVSALHRIDIDSVVLALRRLVQEETKKCT